MSKTFLATQRVGAKPVTDPTAKVIAQSSYIIFADEVATALVAAGQLFIINIDVREQTIKLQKHDKGYRLGEVRNKPYHRRISLPRTVEFNTVWERMAKGIWHLTEVDGDVFTFRPGHSPQIQLTHAEKVLAKLQQFLGDTGDYEYGRNIALLTLIEVVEELDKDGVYKDVIAYIRKEV